jgi:hypothetical protein
VTGLAAMSGPVGAILAVGVLVPNQSQPQLDKEGSS